MANNFHIDAKERSMKDIIRPWMYQATFTDINKVAPKTAASVGIDDLIVRCNNVQVPASVTETIEVMFMGTKQYFPGKRHNGGQVSMTFYEFQDQGVNRFFYEWTQRQFGLDPENDIMAGGSSFATKRLGTMTVRLDLFAYNKEPLPYGIAMYNCFPTNVDGLTLNFNSGEAASQSVQLQCDFWKFVKAGTTTDYIMA